MSRLIRMPNIFTERLYEPYFSVALQQKIDMVNSRPMVAAMETIMNTGILENAAIYANCYRTSYERRYGKFDAVALATLRAHLASKFGAVYAAVLAI